MEKALYSDSYLVCYEGIIMQFGAIRGWIQMGEVTYDDLRPASYDESVAYSKLNLGK